MGQIPNDVDERLWVEAEGYEGRLFLTHNPHTFPGRVGAWLAADAVYTSISKDEITQSSDEARYWIDGFLAGNEPDAEEMFGRSIHHGPDNDPRWRRWSEAAAAFRRSGVWPHEGWHDLTPFPPSTKLPPFVWTVRGDEVWTWDGDRWVLADPQPERSFRLIKGSVCAERRHCDLTMVTALHAVCDDCGHTSEQIPAS